MAVAATDVLDAVRAAWANDATLAGLVPVARVYTGRDAEGTALPRAVLTCERADTQPTTGPALVAWTVTATVYAAADTSLRDVLRAVPAAFAGLTVTGAAQVLPARPLDDGGVAVTGERTAGGDVVRGQRKVRLLTAVETWLG